MIAQAHQTSDPAHAQAHLELAASKRSEVLIRTDEKYRYIKSNGLPDHAPGQFPNSGNPNSISAQDYHYRMTRDPKYTGTPDFYHGYFFGVAVNGVPFDPATAEFWQGNRAWNYEALSGQINLGLDEQNAHVQPNGAYHYHGVPKALMSYELSLIGYAADGFPIYASRTRKYKSSYRLKSGMRPRGAPEGEYDGTFTADYEYLPEIGDLDACNGFEYQGMYIYLLTQEFPHVPRCFMGTPDESFRHQSGGQGQGAGRGDSGGRRPPPERRGRPLPRDIFAP